jgi:protein-S-isoprenylcysteine O-methyltransferase Ste14
MMKNLDIVAAAVSLIMACPDLTVDRLLFNVFFTVWMVIGAILEERDLVVTFGEAYRKYQRKVPMLIPYHIRAIRKSGKI